MMEGYRQTSIVVGGRLNPLIFHPEWFSRYDLLPTLETESALTQKNATIVTGDYASVRFASCYLEVVPDRFEIRTERPDWTADLGGIVGSIFKLLPHTPLDQLGFRMIHHRP